MPAFVLKNLRQNLSLVALVIASAVVAASEAQAQQMPTRPVTTPSEEVLLGSTTMEPNRTKTIVGTPYPYTTGGDAPFSGSVTLNQDIFFGFYPIINGAYSINDKVALTFYGTFWTNPAFTPSGTGGSGLWTEIGGGLSFSVLDGALSINPQLGFLNGSLLSGSSRADTFEGLVAQISFSHAGRYTEGQLYGAYYLATEAPSTNDFAHWWLTAGVRPFADCTNWTQIFSVGGHFEQLYRTKFKGGQTSNLYTWLGLYVQLTLPNNVFLRVNGGWDLKDNISGTFYKVTMGYSF
jgi:hypothetical protein